MKRFIISGPQDAVQLWKALPCDDLVRLHRIDPLSLLLTMTARDEVVLLEEWETDPASCALVVVGTWLKLTFYRIEAYRLVECGPRSPVLEFVDGNLGVKAVMQSDPIDDVPEQSWKRSA